MQERTTRRPVTFRHPFSLPGVDGMLAAGTYEIETTEELMNGLSFTAYRRVSTVISLAGNTASLRSRQLVEIDPHDLELAEQKDVQASRSFGGSAERH